MSKPPVTEEAFEVVPFTIVRDSNEQSPWQFNGITGRSRNGVKLPQVVRIVEKPMWSWDRKERGVGLADYSIDGLEYEVQIERKSVDDLFGTLSERRENFENEIARLNSDCKAAYVIVEGGIGHVMSYRERKMDPSSVIGTYVAWSQRYRNVHWLFAGSRDAAERIAFRMLERYWLDREEEKKQAAKELKKLATAAIA